jgi:hypothetical protein
MTSPIHFGFWIFNFGLQKSSRPSWPERKSHGFPGGLGLRAILILNPTSDAPAIKNQKSKIKNEAGDGARTHDSHVGNVALYH